MSIRYPLDIGFKAENNHPYIAFEIVKFRNRNFIEDSKPLASGEVVKDYNIEVDKTYKVEVLDTIYLPLPDNIQNTYSPNWEMADLRVVETIRDVLNTQGFLNSSKLLASSLASLTVGEAAKRILSKTPNPKKQALFNGIEPRGFTFSWTLIPYSKQEAEQIQLITKAFSENSLPNLENSTDSFFDFPAEFGISFGNVTGFPKYDYCVCNGVNISYSQYNTQVMEDGRPSQITLNLSFMETSLRTKKSPGI